MEQDMADDPSLETQISAITDLIKVLLKERNKLKLLDMAKYNRLQKKISRLHEQRDQLKKALTGNEG
jgi:DNA replication initiation complex subunit (GINS family)